LLGGAATGTTEALRGKKTQSERGSGAVRYLKVRFFAARQIYSIEQGNAQLVEFIDKASMQRQLPVHFQHTIRDLFEQDELMR
jgi:hypothetical protein